MEFDPPCADMRDMFVRKIHTLMSIVEALMCRLHHACGVSILHVADVDRYVIGRHDVHILCWYVEFDSPRDRYLICMSSRRGVLCALTEPISMCGVSHIGGVSSPAIRGIHIPV